MNRNTASCLDCCAKHLAQASVLFDESRNGYPLHHYLAMGHMAEAESESLLEHSELTFAIREERLKLQSGETPDLIQLLGIIHDLKGTQVNENS
jgi:hypothetical protein